MEEEAGSKEEWRLTMVDAIVAMARFSSDRLTSLPSAFSACGSCGCLAENPVTAVADSVLPSP